MNAWLHGETIDAFLEFQRAHAFILEDFHTLNILAGKEVKFP